MLNIMTSQNQNFIETFLRENGLLQFGDNFNENGFLEYLDLCILNETDLEKIGIKQRSDRHRILKCIDNLPIDMWLEFFKLQDFIPLLKSQNVSTLGELKSLLFQKEVLDQWVTVSFAAKMRFQLAVSCLTKSPVVSGRSHIVDGEWKVPDLEFLHREGNTRKFLCVNAKLKSSSNARESNMLEFLVDSGSNIVTVPEDIIEDLELIEIGNTVSIGVHSKTERKYYKSTLILGKAELEVEVIADILPSVGITVLHKFDHLIIGDRHLWMSRTQQQLQPQQA